MEWAYATGHSKKYASAGWASYDSHFFRWAEAGGYAVDLATQHELHDPAGDPGGLRLPRLRRPRRILDLGDARRRRGLRREGRPGRALRRQLHVADPPGGRGPAPDLLQVPGARRGSGLRRARPARTTTSWEAPEVGRPGAETFGLNATRGLYAGWGGCAPRGVRGFPVYRPEHWAFAGTGLYYGDLLGAETHIFGYEVDGLDYVIRNGLPEATGVEGAPEGIEILALGQSSLIEESADIPRDAQFLTDEDARFAAAPWSATIPPRPWRRSSAAAA